MKTTTRKGIVLAAVTLFILVFTAVAGADAQWGPRFGHHGRAGGGPGMGAGPHMGMGLGILGAAKKLELSEDQQQQLKKIHRSVPGTIMPKMQAVMEAQMELKELMDQDDLDKAKLQRAHQQLLDARSALANAKFELRISALSVLTAEQRQELQKQKRSGRWDERGNRPGRRAPRRLQRGYDPDAWEF